MRSVPLVMFRRSQRDFRAPVKSRLGDAHVVGRDDHRIQIFARGGNVPRHAEAAVCPQSDAAAFPGNGWSPSALE